MLIAGPTASGKSALAMALAEQVSAVVINADSMQVYRDLRVLTARPSIDDEARAPHRLFGTIDGGDACSAARWADDARAVIAAVHAERGVPILVGGTGLYIRTLLGGIAPIPPIDADVRAAVRALPVDRAHAALRAEDPASAAGLAASDSTRIARALEVIRSTGRSIAEWRREPAGGIADAVALHPLVLAPPREALAAVIDARFAAMVDVALPEVEALLARDLDPALPVMRAIGVPQLAAFLRGETDRQAAVAAATLATRQYAKRQATWFARQVPAGWPRSATAGAAAIAALRDDLLT